MNNQRLAKYIATGRQSGERCLSMQSARAVKHDVTALKYHVGFDCAPDASGARVRTDASGGRERV
jgi:hypothetical protein